MVVADTIDGFLSTGCTIAHSTAGLKNNFRYSVRSHRVATSEQCQINVGASLDVFWHKDRYLEFSGGCITNGSAEINILATVHAGHSHSTAAHARSDIAAIYQTATAAAGEYAAQCVCFEFVIAGQTRQPC